ncbi:carbohydrate-binding protein [Paenibacillus sp. NPDC058174]|uniref:carbohydrate-binding protein n=1 Tax=Paenibacillus sp. NPDC058174 TaxID=3346366 RepID=UPI0036DEED74
MIHASDNQVYKKWLAAALIVALLLVTMALKPSSALAASAFTQTAASSYSAQSGIQLEASSEGGQNVAFIDNGDYLRFDGVDFGTGANAFNARVASNASGGAIEVRLGSLTGTLAATCTVPGTGGWQNWTTVTCSVSGNPTGVQTLFLKFTGGAGNLFNINWFRFNPSTPQTTGGDVVGKVFAGYQGWFNAAGDGSPNGGWIHWSKNSSAPGTGSNVNFDLYPDLREYSKLYQTNLQNLNNGQQAKLFSSYDQETVNKHFEWMQTYNIDGAALQRFGASASTSPDNWRTNRDSVAVKVKNAAETYGRKFYVMYDTSGMNASTWVNDIKYDWTNKIQSGMNLTSSSAYAKQNGKIVVNIWGIGFTDRPGTAAEAAGLIQWFKDQNVYVIGGVPTYWRTGVEDSKSGFLSVYQSFDMLSPWYVGRFSGEAGADHFKNNFMQQDLAMTNQLGIAYQPVLWPGFSWYNLHGGPQNQIPRLHGDFMWRQAYNVKSLGINTAYVAMFDEYDEGTAIAKAAENSSMIPANQYFLTLNADGVAVSSDFYLRLTGDINRMLKGQIPLTAQHPTSHQ